MNSVHWQQSTALTIANLKTRYRNTISGLVWVILNPLLVFGAQATVFHFILKINVERYPLFLVAGLLPWIFLQQSVEMGTGTFTASGRLLKSFPVHPFVILSAQILDNLFNFVLGFTIILIPTAIYYQFEYARYLLVPLALVPLFIFVLAFVFLLATVQVFFWDTRFVMSFVMTVLYYLTPIIYPISMIDEKYRWVVNLNPIWHLLRPFQVSIVGDIAEFSVAMTNACGVAAFAVVCAYIFWRRSKNEFYFYL